MRSPIQERVSHWGFGLSGLLLTIEYLTAGRFPGWILLVPTNPTILVAALVGHRVEELVGARWADEAYFCTLGLDSAVWWYLVGVFAIRLRRLRHRQS
jgi:hypothetical protein